MGRRKRRKDIPKTLAELPDVLDVSDVAAFFDVAETTVYEAIQQHRIPALKFGRRIKISKRVVERILEDGKLCDTPERREELFNIYRFPKLA